MRNPYRIRRPPAIPWPVIVVTCILALAALSGVLAASALRGTALADGPLRLLCSRFECNATYRGAPEVLVAEGWEPWWNPNSARPEYKMALASLDARRVRSGAQAQQWFNSYNTHTAGIYQQIAGIPFGSQLHFEAWVQCFSSGSDDFSQSRGRYRMRIGIDPYGDTDPESGDIVWSDEGNSIQPYDAYRFLEVDTVARSDRVTVYVWGQAEWPLKHNDAYVDDAHFIVSGTSPEPGVTPTPGTGSGTCPSLEEIRRVIRDELDRSVLTIQSVP